MSDITDDVLTRCFVRLREDGLIGEDVIESLEREFDDGHVPTADTLMRHLEKVQQYPFNSEVSSASDR